MAYHPLNLALRFLLELVAVGGIAAFGWRMFDGRLLRWAAAAALAILAMAIWGTFAVPDDPSRSGRAPVPVPGAVRLVLELAFLGLGAWGLHAAQATTASLVFAAAIVVHYQPVVEVQRVAPPVAWPRVPGSCECTG